jgi:hypothetical protein
VIKEKAAMPRKETFEQKMKRCRGIDFVKIGMRVEVDGEPGTIVGSNDSANLDVKFSNRLKFPAAKYNCHPFYRTRYFDTAGNVVADYTKKSIAS